MTVGAYSDQAAAVTMAGVGKERVITGCGARHSTTSSRPVPCVRSCCRPIMIFPSRKGLTDTYIPHIHTSHDVRWSFALSLACLHDGCTLPSLSPLVTFPGLHARDAACTEVSVIQSRPSYSHIMRLHVQMKGRSDRGAAYLPHHFPLPDCCYCFGVRQGSLTTSPHCLQPTVAWAKPCQQYDTTHHHATSIMHNMISTRQPCSLLIVSFNMVLQHQTRGKVSDLLHVSLI